MKDGNGSYLWEILLILNSREKAGSSFPFQLLKTLVETERT